VFNSIVNRVLAIRLKNALLGICHDNLLTDLKMEFEAR
jgi:hypothetical protein